MAFQQGSEDVQILADLLLLQQVSPTFTRFLMSSSFSARVKPTAQIIACQMTALRSQVASMNTLMPSELQLKGLQSYPFPESTTDMLHELDRWLSDDVINRLESAPHGQGNAAYPRLKALRDLKGISPEAVTDDALLKHFCLHFRSKSHVQKALRTMLQMTDHMISHLKRLAPIEEEEDSNLMQHVRDVREFSDYSIDLLEKVSEGLTCVKEHQLHAHLSGYGYDDWNFEFLLEPCSQPTQHPGSYPVTISRISNANVNQGNTLKPLDICQHIRRIRRTLRKAQLHYSQNSIWAANTVGLKRLTERELVQSFNGLTKLLAEDNSSGLGRSDIRRLQCLLAQSLLYLWSSPWMIHLGDLERISIAATTPVEGFAKLYLRQSVTPASNTTLNAPQERYKEIDHTLFMARFGLLLLQLEHHKVLRLPEADNAELDNEVTTLFKYLEELPKPPDSILQILEICTEFPDYVDHFYGRSAYDYDERCRLTILTKIMRPLIADLAENHTNACEKSQSLRMTRDLLNEGVRNEPNVRKRLAADSAKAELRKKKQILAGSDQLWWVPPISLREAWDTIDVQVFLESQGAKIDERFCRLMKETYLSLLSILLFIDWDGWPYLNVLVFRDQERLLQDQSLPVLDLHVFGTYLDPHQVEKFVDAQCHYMPLVLPVAPSAGNIEEISIERPLPFLFRDKQPPTPKNAKMWKTQVFKHDVPAGCLRNRNGQLNQHSVRVVRKVINGRTRDNEEKAVRVFQDCNLQHDAILEILTMYRRSGNLEIIYPLAETDLDVFTTEMSYDTHWVTKDALASLLIEMRSLASGLKYLHGGLEDRVRQDPSVCHMDFKPDNILVFLTNEQTSRGTQRKFRFKISDFGIAKIRPKSGHKIFLEQAGNLQADMTENPTSIATRHAGTFSAPEMKYNASSVGLKSDVWSFACIFLRLLIRLLLGIEGLNEFDDARSAANHREDFFFSDINPSGCEELNAAVAAALDRLSDPSDSLSVGMEKKLKDRSHVQIPLKSAVHIRDNLPIVLGAALKVRDADRCSSHELYAALTTVLARET